MKSKGRRTERVESVRLSTSVHARGITSSRATKAIEGPANSHFRFLFAHRLRRSRGGSCAAGRGVRFCTAVMVSSVRCLPPPRVRRSGGRLILERGLLGVLEEELAERLVGG